MKIAVYYNLAFGGAKRVVQEHVRGLQSKKHIVDVYTTDGESDIFDPGQVAHKLYRYPTKQPSLPSFLDRFAKDYYNFFTLKKLHKQIAEDIDKRKYDIVLVHPDKMTQAPFLLQFLKTPSTYYCQEPLRIAYDYSMRFSERVGMVKKGYEELTRIYRKGIDRENVRAATHTIASCYHIRERMIEAYDVYPDVVYCAVNDTVFRPKNIKKTAKVFYVGSPDVFTDGFDLIDSAIQLIPKKIRPELFRLSWVKENNERLSEEELVSLYSQSLVTVCSSRFETFGLVPLESMACGTPVIATNVSGHRETVRDTETGFLVDFKPKEIAEKIQFVIEHPEIAKKLGKQARKHIEEHLSWRVVINDLEKVLLTYTNKR